MENKRILIVEDDADIAGLLCLHLQDLGAETTVAVDGHEGLRYACAKSWDLIVLDIQLPGPSGLEICRKVRQNQNYVPILLLTSRSTELDRVLGLDMGADDYITKPFSVMELIARIRAVFRRETAMRQSPVIQSEEHLDLGALHIDERTHTASLAGEALDLTAKEFLLLLHFARSPDRVFNRAELLDSVWGYGHDGYEHTVNSHINRLRTKMETDSRNPQFIVTVWGVGYKLNAQALHGLGG